jgi:hypothetical protein
MKVSKNDRIIKAISDELVTGDDGYVVWWPSDKGAINAWQLRVIADYLDERNKPWDEIVRREMGGDNGDA